MSKIDTSIDGFKYVGINLTEKQYQDLCQLSILLMNEDRKNIPVFNVMVLLKILGLLPTKMMYNSRNGDTGNYSDSNVNDTLQRKFGKGIS